MTEERGEPADPRHRRRTHYAVTWDYRSSSWRIYTNGDISSTESYTQGTWTATKNPLMMGRNDASGVYSSTNFELDEVAFYHTALSSDAVQRHFEVGGGALSTPPAPASPATFTTGSHCESVVASTYRKAILADSPEGYWPLDGCSGVAVDVSGNGHNGTAEGSTSPIVFGEGPLLPSGNGSSVRFSANGYGDATSQRIRVPGWEKRPSGATGLTLEFWLKLLPDAKFTGYAAIISDRLSDSNPGGPWLFQVYVRPKSCDADSYIHFRLKKNEVNLPLPTVGARTYYAITWDYRSSSWRIYTNGDISSTESYMQGTWTATQNPLMMGRNDASGVYSSTNFELDEVAFYHTALSSDAVQRHFEVGGGALSTPRAPASPATFTTGSHCESVVASTYRKAILADSPGGYWPLDGCSGVAVDVSGNGHNGAVEGSTSPIVFGEGPLLPSGNGSSVRFSANGYGDSTSQRIRVPGWEKRPSGATGLTLEFWLKLLPDAKFTGYAAIISDRLSDSNPGGPWLFQVYVRPKSCDADSYIHFRLQKNEVNLPLPTDGARTYYAVTWDYNSGIGRIYTNGDISSTESYTQGTWTATQNPLMMGRNDASGVYSSTNFELDEVAFYHTALSSDAVQRHFEVGGGVTGVTGVSDFRSTALLIGITACCAGALIVLVTVVIRLLRKTNEKKAMTSSTAPPLVAPTTPTPTLPLQGGGAVQGTVVVSVQPQPQPPPAYTTGAYLYPYPATEGEGRQPRQEAEPLQQPQQPVLAVLLYEQSS